MLRINLLGDLEVQRDGTPLALPPSRKTRALLAYLVLEGAPQRREALCELFWDVPDDPRGALRWSLSRLRPLLNAEAEHLLADRERVAFVPAGAAVDIHEAEAVVADLSRLDTAALRALLARFRGPLMAGLELSSVPAFDSWRLGRQEAARQIHIRLLDALAARLDDPRTRAEVLRRRIDVDPGGEAAHLALVELLAREGLGSEAEQQASASARMLAAIGPYDKARLMAASRARPPAPLSARPTSTAEPARPSKTGEPLARSLEATEPQSIRFCAARDGTRIAFATTGTGPPLLKTANWMNHLEHDWESPVWRGLFGALAGPYRLVRYDERGNGLSDWDVADLSLDAFVEDLAAVADAAGLDRFPILGISQGAAVAIEYAARYPERVTRLVLVGGFARGWRHGSAALAAHTEALKTLMARAWGKDNPAFRQMFTSLFMPHGTPAQVDAFNTLQKLSASPENAVRLLDAFGDFDVRHRFADIRVPTLVIHCRGDAFIPIGLGREIATGIPNARFVSLDSDAHLPIEGDPTLPRLVAEMQALLAEPVGSSAD
jgi:pimeloyl-ACP methyl ester carboxylesterase/DNA-binding SARP family transcriptional activator